MAIKVTRRQVETAPLPNARLSVDRQPVPTTAPLPDLSGVERVAQDVFQAAVARADQLAVLEADNALDEAQREIETDVRTRLRGKAALTASDEAGKQFDARADKVGATLASERQRQAFAQRRLARRQAMVGQLDQYGMREHDQWETDTTKAALESRARLAAEAVNPNVRLQAMLEGKAILNDYWRARGADAGMLRAQEQAFTSQVHGAVLGAMLTQENDLAAQAYLDKHRGEMAPNLVAAMERSLTDASTRGTALRTADAILATGGGFTEWKAQAAEITNPKVRVLVEDRLRQERADRDREERDAREAVLTDATAWVRQHGSASGLPSRLLAGLSADEHAGLVRYARFLQKGDPVETDPEVYYRLRTMAASGKTQPAFLRENLLQYRTRLDDADLGRLMEIQADLRAGTERADAQSRAAAAKRQQENAGFLTTLQTVDGIYEQAYGPPRAGNADDQKRHAAFRLRVHREVAALEAREGREATADEVETLASTLVVRGRTVDGDDERSVFEAQPGERLIITTSDIPAGARQQIIAALAADGEPVTEQAILRKYRRYLSTLLPQTPGTK
jgi:hypothetical protein